MSTTRYALIALDSSASEVLSRYLPGNYKLAAFTQDDGREVALISGEDHAGWTLDGYVLPRLASGLYPGREVDASHPAVARVVIAGLQVQLDAANAALNAIATYLSEDDWDADTLEAIYTAVTATGRIIGEL